MNAHPPPGHASAAFAEADRLMTICNACRYCEGLCAVFPAMELRRRFADGDLAYLANLCHGCGACYADCQFAPPHEFRVNVPAVFAELRAQTWRRYAWPAALAPLFDRNGLWIALIAALAVTGFIAGFVAWHDSAVLFGTHTGPGAFYRLMPHGAMVAMFGAAFLYALVALATGLVRFWRDIGEPAAALADGRALGQAAADAASLRYLGGGGAGCFRGEDRPDDARRLYHHFTFWGFVLCFAATSVATLYHYAFGYLAPYPWWDLPVVLGTVGGIGLLVGPVGLLAEKWRRDPALADPARFGMDAAFLAMLFLTSLTGLLLLLLRATPAMGLLLALHLGVVFAFFLTMPYGRFVHGLYRFAALVRHARERRRLAKAPPG